ncbi:snRNA-activating protein complex subunit-like [Actinidia eriantha]|uniref:snRNA-activating protein complex subunit-like n=1 Tax=Actinidia eriantha TaxID=165200 RepID=UPI00258C6CBA|nr:snRNA-activating protein complex subunit-like [Actinidia eriantha]
MDSVTKVNLLKVRGDHALVIYPEIVRGVEVYNIKKFNQVKTQEMLVLGCQYLTELREKICCVTDQIMHKAGQFDPSGYFLIENVFCNDLRGSKAIDYSEPILNWFRDTKNEVIAKWDRLYLYCHQGNCKYLVVMRDMSQICPKDAQNRGVYPSVMFQFKEQFQKCSVCKIYRAEKVIVNDKWAKKNPC